MADPPPDWPHGLGRWMERYDTQSIDCAACASRERKAWNDQQGRDAGQLPIVGRYYAVTLEEEY